MHTNTMDVGCRTHTRDAFNVKVQTAAATITTIAATTPTSATINVENDFDMRNCTWTWNLNFANVWVDGVYTHKTAISGPQWWWKWNFLEMKSAREQTTGTIQLDLHTSFVENSEITGQPKQ